MNDQEINIHVRFSNGGTVADISLCPDGVSPQRWFDRLTKHTQDSFRALAGGRGVFTLPGDQINRLQTLEV